MEIILLAIGLFCIVVALEVILPIMYLMIFGDYEEFADALFYMAIVNSLVITILLARIIYC